MSIDSVPYPISFAIDEAFNAIALRGLAYRLIESGISFLPVRVNGSKRPALHEWGHLTERFPTSDEIEEFFRRPAGIGAICGAISGGLECLDFDCPGLISRFADRLGNKEILRKVVPVSTPSGGFHLWYRSCEIEGSQKLAMNLAGKTLIETRGEIAYALLPGSPIECHESRRAYSYARDRSILDVREITISERNELFEVAKSFNEYVPSSQPSEPLKPFIPPADGMLPGDHFDLAGDWCDVLSPYGWKLEEGDWERGLVTRPGKCSGVSGSIGRSRGHRDEPLLTVFSTNAIPFEEKKTYGRFRALSLLKYRGDCRATARALAASGYGRRVSR